MVGDGEVVIDGFGDAHDLAIDLLLGEEFGEFGAGVHRIVATVDEHVTDVVVQNRLANGFITKVVEIARHFITGGA